jgi:hypothetical protein
MITYDGMVVNVEFMMGWLFMMTWLWTLNLWWDDCLWWHDCLFLHDHVRCCHDHVIICDHPLNFVIWICSSWFMFESWQCSCCSLLAMAYVERRHRIARSIQWDDQNPGLVGCLVIRECHPRNRSGSPDPMVDIGTRWPGSQILDPPKVWVFDPGKSGSDPKIPKIDDFL